MAPSERLTKTCQASQRNTRARRASRPPSPGLRLQQAWALAPAYAVGRALDRGYQRQACGDALPGAPGAEGAGSGVTLPGSRFCSPLSECVSPAISPPCCSVSSSVKWGKDSAEVPLLWASALSHTRSSREPGPRPWSWMACVGIRIPDL